MTTHYEVYKNLEAIGVITNKASRKFEIGNFSGIYASLEEGFLDVFRVFNKETQKEIYSHYAWPESSDEIADNLSEEAKEFFRLIPVYFKEELDTKLEGKPANKVSKI
ncbi:hypothetical protein [Burkholderia metallica]|uniref:hypothetical protein n=1 Tax=Burkholderia metallica TaxID=488729 RepID=UPI00158CF0B4|nr:hypothetical protein [Burkholderia metallica]